MENREILKSDNMDTSLKSDFSYPEYDEWKKSAISSLKGKDFEKALRTLTYEGIALDPIYDKKDLEGLSLDSLPGSDDFLRGLKPEGNIGNGWNICQRMGSGVPEHFNKELISALDSGQNSIFISTDRPTSTGIDPDKAQEDQVCVNGLSLSVLKDMTDAFNKIDITKYPLIFDTNISGMELFMLLNAYLNEKGIDIGRVRGDLNFDPIGFLAGEGKLDSNPDHYYKKLALLIKKLGRDNSKMRVTGVSVLPYKNSGASSVQELAIALATGVEYIEALKNHGISPSETASSLSFKFGIGSDYFMEIAKLRSGRVLWNKILEEYGIPEGKRSFYVHSETSMFNQSALDPYVNMLRITTEAFSAIAGGADTLTTNPFDKVFAKSGEFSRRVTRNVQIVLKEESHLHRMIDPAGGSYFVEKLTSDLSEKAWDLFLEIEEKGGVLKALESGFLSQQIGEGKAKLEKLIAKRKKIMVGTNNFGNPDEVVTDNIRPGTDPHYTQRMTGLKEYKESKKEIRGSASGMVLKDLFEKMDPDVMDEGINHFSRGGTIGEISSVLADDETNFTVNSPDISRLSHKMELLRRKVDRMKKLPDSSSIITVAVNEPFLKIKPRGDFSKSFFETGGFNSSIIRIEGSVEEKADKIKAEGNRIIVLCAADEDYPGIVPDLVEAVKKRVVDPIFLLAGDPGDNRVMYLKSGIDLFIYRGIDLLEIISGILKRSGVENG
ncbi:MAG: methylmalonyl-CoA mutase family protein [Acidobacteriota bacterium]